jgi:hypothetical protein
MCHLDRSEERAKWRDLAVWYVKVLLRLDFSTPKFVETNFSGRNDTIKNLRETADLIGENYSRNFLYTNIALI